MNLEAKAARLLSIALVVLFGGVFAYAYWFPVVRHALGLAGATLYYFAWPIIGVIVVFLVIFMGKFFRHL